MDFVVLMSIYVLCFGIFLVIFSFGYSPEGTVAKQIKSVLGCCTELLPDGVRNILSRGCDYVLFERNHVMQIIYGGLVLAGHIVLVVDIFPIVYTLAASENHVILPLALVLINTVFFNLTCVTDPGEITQDNQKLYSPAYDYDTIMYKVNTKCRTCKIPKLPRSKHCSVCDRCVYRFDHHCVWTNNCIGGLNHHYFILFLLSICVMSINGVIVCWKSMALVVYHFNMLSTNYVDGSGNLQPVNLIVLSQHLFLKFPRIVFTMVSLVFIIVAVGGFTGYHIWLVSTNQTTNERYKRDSFMSRKTRAKTSKCTRMKVMTNVYDRGTFQNVYEIVCPRKFLHKKARNI